MFLIAFFIFVSKAIILQSLPQYSDFQFNTFDFECENIGLTENVSFYVENQQDSNIIQKNANNFQELFNDKWNSTFINLIYEEIFLPQSILILQTQKIAFEIKTFICSLIQYKENQDYQIYCTQEMKQQMIDDKIKFNLIHEFSFSIQNEQNQQCQNFLFVINQFYILCLNDDYIIIITLDMKGNQQLQKILITNSKCQTKFKYTFDHYYIISLYQCIKWEIIILDEKMLIFNRISSSQIQSEKNDTYQYLQDIQYCQEKLILNFTSIHISFDYQNLNTNIKYELFYQNENTQMFICLAQSKFYLLNFPLQFQEMIISATLSYDWKDIFILGNSIILVQYSDHLVAILAKKIKQIININIKQLVLLTDNIQFFIVDQFNNLSLFKADQFQILHSYQQNQNYVGFFRIKYFQLYFIKCFQIKQYKNELLKIQDQIRNLRNKNYLIKIDDNFDNQILIDKLSFILEKNINLTFSFPSLFKKKYIQDENNDQCQLFRRKLSNFSIFYILKRNSKNYILYNDENQSLVIYNCSSSRQVKYNLKLDLNTIKTYYEVENFRFILIQETLGKIVTFGLSSQEEKSIIYKIYQFKEQIRISCIFQNQLIIQLVNSSELYFEFQNENQFLNLSGHHEFNFDFLFNQNFNGAIKILTIKKILIFQFETYLLIYQSNLLYLIINKKLNILGGYLYNSKVLQLILLAIDQEMNTIHKYLITKLDYYLVSTFSFSDYFPIQPLRYQIQQSHFIIVTVKQDQTQFHLLLFNFLNCYSFNYYQIISTPNENFYIQNDNLYYYNNQELISIQLKYYSFNFQLQELNQIFYKLELKININYTTSLQNYNYEEKLNLLLFNSQFDLKQINQHNRKILIKQDQNIIYPNLYVVGYFTEISLINNNAFMIQNPFKVINRNQCYYIYNGICLIQDSKNIQLYDLSSNAKMDQFLNIDIMIQDQAYIFSCNKGFIFVEQLDSDLIQITYFTQNIRNNQFMVGLLFSASLKQSLLIVQTNNLTNYYFIEEQINLLYSYNFIDQQNRNFYLNQIGSNQVCQTAFQLLEININCFQISQNTISPIKNYTIFMKDIYNQMQFYEFLPNFLEKLDLEALNLSKIQENELELIFLLYNQKNLIFYFQIILNNYGYHIKINNIIRYPQYFHKCNSYILKHKLLFDCSNLQMFIFDIQNELQILDSYAIQIILNQQIDIINNTHIALFDQRNLYVEIIELDYWRIIKNPNVSLNEQKFLTFCFQNHLTKLEFQVEIINETNIESELNIIVILVIAINNLFVILFIKIKKLKRK